MIAQSTRHVSPTPLPALIGRPNSILMQHEDACLHYPWPPWLIDAWEHPYSTWLIKQYPGLGQMARQSENRYQCQTIILAQQYHPISPLSNCLTPFSICLLGALLWNGVYDDHPRSPVILSWATLSLDWKFVTSILCNCHF